MTWIPGQKLGQPRAYVGIKFVIMGLWQQNNKANLRDLIAATFLVILLNIGFKSSIFGPCDLQIWWMTSINNRAPLLSYIKLCASFQTHWWIQTAVTVQKCSIWVKIDDFLSCVALKFDGWPWQTIGHLFYATSKLCTWFQSHRWIQTGVIVRKRSILLKISDICPLWPWNFMDDLEK